MWRCAAVPPVDGQSWQRHSGAIHFHFCSSHGCISCRHKSFFKEAARCVIGSFLLLSDIGVRDCYIWVMDASLTAPSCWLFKKPGLHGNVSIKILCFDYLETKPEGGHISCAVFSILSDFHIRKAEHHIIFYCWLSLLGIVFLRRINGLNLY